MKTRTKLLVGCISIIIGLMLSSCSSNHIDMTIASISPTLSPTSGTTSVSTPFVLPVNTLPAKSASNEPIITKSSDQATAASNNVQISLATEAKPKSYPLFNFKQPELMGLAIGEAQDKAITQYGKPIESYIMEDPTEPITVYQYEGFSIGFNTTNEIQFVDVSSTKVNPGLSGLRLGQTSSQALELLGKPDKNTSYVISYNTKTAILKLDIDPKTRTIQSIKLFAVDGS